MRVDRDRNILVSRREGQVFVLSSLGALVEILDTLPAGKNTADFEFIPEKNLLVIPTFVANKVVAFEVDTRDVQSPKPGQASARGNRLYEILSGRDRFAVDLRSMMCYFHQKPDPSR